MVAKKFDPFMNLRMGRMTKPSADEDDRAKLQEYYNIQRDLTNVFNDKKKGMNPDHFKMFVFEVVIEKLLSGSRMYKAWAPDKVWEVFVDFYVEFFSRLDLQMPSLAFRELAIAFCLNKNCLLIPQLPN